MTCLRPPRGAWRGQERGSGFSWDGHFRQCAVEGGGVGRTEELCRAAKGVCVSLRANRHFQLIRDTHHQVVSQPKVPPQTKSNAGCKRGLAEGAISQEHPIPQVAGRWPWHKGGHKKKENNCEGHTLVSKQRDKATSRLYGEESGAGEGSVVSSQQ